MYMASKFMAAALFAADGIVSLVSLQCIIALYNSNNIAGTIGTEVTNANLPNKS